MPVRNEFQSSIYNTTDAMLYAIAEAFLTANGLNSVDDVAGFLRAMTDREMAEECINEWGLDQTPDGFRNPHIDDEPPALSHRDLNGYTVDDLAEAFGEYRKSVAA